MDSARVIQLYYGSFVSQVSCQDGPVTLKLAISLMLFLQSSECPFLFVHHSKQIKPQCCSYYRLENNSSDVPLACNMDGGRKFCTCRCSNQIGLSARLGLQLLSFSGLPLWVMLGTACHIVSFLTEVTSNSATVTLLMLIIASEAFAETLNRFHVACMYVYVCCLECSCIDNRQSYDFRSQLS